MADDESSDKGFSLVNVGFGKFAKPVNTLIEKIASATGMLYEPTRIRRLAKANADKAKIEVFSKIEIDDLQRRALERFIREESVKQHNMEAITEKALPLVKTNAKAAEVSNDWVANFFEKAKLSSDEDVQMLWAKILSGEANEPGSFSKRTVNLVAELSKHDCVCFEALKSFSVDLLAKDDRVSLPMVFDDSDAMYVENGVTFSRLANLESIGLIRFDAAGNFVTTFKSAGPEELDYHGHQFSVNLLKGVRAKKWHIPLGRVIYTNSGEELAKIATGKTVEGFVDYVQNRLSKARQELVQQYKLHQQQEGLGR